MRIVSGTGSSAVCAFVTRVLFAVSSVAVLGGLLDECRAEGRVVSLNVPVRVQLASLETHQQQIAQPALSLSNEPFAVATAPVINGNIVRKWRDVQNGLFAEQE